MVNEKWAVNIALGWLDAQKDLPRGYVYIEFKWYNKKKKACFLDVLCRFAGSSQPFRIVEIIITDDGTIGFKSDKRSSMQSSLITPDGSLNPRLLPIVYEYPDAVSRFTQAMQTPSDENQPLSIRVEMMQRMERYAMFDGSVFVRRKLETSERKMNLKLFVSVRDKSTYRGHFGQKVKRVVTLIIKPYHSDQDILKALCEEIEKRERS